MVYRRLGENAKSSQALKHHQQLVDKAKEPGTARVLGLNRWLSGECVNQSN